MIRTQCCILLALALAAVCLDLSAVQGADSSAAAATLKATDANVYAIKEGGGTGVSFQNFKLDEASWRALESLIDLKELRISGSGKDFGDAQLSRLCEIKTIELIFMNAYGGTEAGLAALAKLPKLRHFGADHSPFTGTGLIALKNSPHFVSLRLGGCPFNDDGMKALAELKQLKEANISHVLFTSAGFPYFAALTNLEKLTISPNCSPYYIGADLVHLSQLKRLETLVITEMALGYEDGLEHLKGLNLKRLEVRDCRVSDRDLARLKSDLPAASIEAIYSLDERFKGWDRQLERRKSAK